MANSMKFFYDPGHDFIASTLRTSLVQVGRIDFSVLALDNIYSNNNQYWAKIE